MWIPITKARSNFSELISRAGREPAVILRGSEPVAVILSVEEYRELAEARRLAREEPERLVRIAAARRKALKDDADDSGLRWTANGAAEGAGEEAGVETGAVSTTR